MKKVFIAAVAVCSMSFQVQAADANAGQELAKNVCAGCHGADGVSPTPMWPNLKAQKSQYLIKQLEAFKAGTRKDPMMEPIASALTQKQIEDASAYFSSFKP